MSKPDTWEPDGPAGCGESERIPGQYVPGTDLPLRPAVPVTGESAGDDGRPGEQNDPGDGEYVPL